MDWYFGNGMEDFVVPKDQELADGLPSPEDWSKWGITLPENFESSNKCFLRDANLTHEGLRLNGKLCYGADFEASADVKDPSRCSSVCGGLSEESLNQATNSDYQLDDLSKFQQLDDIFLSSLLEDLPGSEDLHKSFCFSPEDQCGWTLAGYFETDVSSDSQSVSNNEHGMGSARYLKTHAFSPSMNLEEEVPAFHKSTMVKAPPAKILVPPEHTSSNGFVSEDASLEESVLQEFEVVMAQLSNKTRICFRDGFYRLAKNSEHSPITLNQHGDLHVDTHHPTWTISEEKMRSGKKDITESETNTIDRAIANLTFNKMETNVKKFPVSEPANFNQDIFKGTRQLDQSSMQSQNHYFPQSPATANDAKVPFLVQSHSSMRMNGHGYGSRTHRENKV